jgi:dTDP-4-dehydrorhamnose reductase
MAGVCAEKRARMVHFSTDYVFDGKGSKPYTEEDEPNPVSVYAESKLAGEEKVLSASERHLIVRLSWLFGPGRPAFPEWVIGQAQKQDNVAVISDKIASPTYAVDVADWLLPLLDPDASNGGLLHLCNGGECAWNEYAAFVLGRAAEHGVPLRTKAVDPVPMSSLAGLSARRPTYSTLDSSRFRNLTGITPRPWKEAVAEHLSRTASTHRAAPAGTIHPEARRPGSARVALRGSTRTPADRRSEP